MIFGFGDAVTDPTLIPDNMQFGPPFDSSLAPSADQVAMPDVVAPVKWAGIVYTILATASFALSVYHGYKRHNGSLGWGLGWGFMGALFPVITPTVAFAQGFGKPMEG